jgi:hypothetical protein
MCSKLNKLLGPRLCVSWEAEINHPYFVVDEHNFANELVSSSRYVFARPPLRAGGYNVTGIELQSKSALITHHKVRIVAILNDPGIQPDIPRCHLLPLIAPSCNSERGSRRSDTTGIPNRSTPAGSSTSFRWAYAGIFRQHGRFLRNIEDACTADVRIDGLTAPGQFGADLFDVGQTERQSTIPVQASSLEYRDGNADRSPVRFPKHLRFTSFSGSVWVVYTTKIA